MGQCSSTLPTNHSTNVGAVSETTTPMTGGSSNQYDMRDRDVVLSDNHNHHNKRGNQPTSTSSNNNKNHGLDFNILTPTTNVNDPMKSRKMMNHSKSTKSYHHHSTSGMDVPPSPQSRDPPTDHYNNNNNAVSPMEIDTRDDAASPIPMSSTNQQQQQLYNYQFMIPSQLKYPLPANAIRTRCYKLNLNAEPIGFSSGSSAATPSKPMFLGPFTETLPTLTFSNDTYDKDDDDDDDDEDDGLTKEGRDIAVAIQTAQIFRGITVSPDGTILSQNARATRSSRGNNGASSTKVKLSEKSRQAAKIDKANDLIEQDGSGDAKLVSLVVIGEYDDMKYLVRDGSRKLREADGLPDDALYAINRPRVSSRLLGGRSPTSQSPNNNAFPSSVRAGVTSSSTVVSSSSSSRRRRATGSTTAIPSPMVSPQQQQLPKLKSNPRDTTSSTQRRSATTPKDNTAGGLRGIRLDSCHEFMDVNSRNNNNNTNSTGKNTTVLSGFGSDNDDWTHAWNLWNCGGGNVGTTSPLQPSSPASATNNSNNRKMGQHADSRNDTSSSTNYGGYTARRVG